MKTSEFFPTLCLLCLTLCLFTHPAASEIVINEIAYHPITDSSAEEYIELYNTGPYTVDLSGWEFTDGISYDFPPGTNLERDSYLVVAKDPTALSVLFPSLLGILGPYDGQLNNAGERVRLEDSAGQVVDRVTYDDALPWPTAADGDGPSLELRHPLLDNLRPENWAASDITDDPSAGWQSISATLAGVSGAFFFFMTDADGEGWIADGETVHVLFDDFVLEDISNPGRNLITDGGFESGDASDWILHGKWHARFASPEDSFTGRYCLHYWALGPGDSWSRKARYTPTVPLSLSADRRYRFHCRYRVTQGYGLLYIGAGDTGSSSVGAGPILLEKRPAWGTPGRSNSAWGSLKTPVLIDLQDVGQQLLSGGTEEVIAAFNDSSLIESVELCYSAQQIAFSATASCDTPDEMDWQRIPMLMDPAPDDNVYRASIHAHEGNTIVRYHLCWHESSGKEHRYPHFGSHPDNLVTFVPGSFPDYGVPHYFLHMIPAYSDFYQEMFRSSGSAQLLLRQSRPSFPVTLVDLEEGCAYEDVLWETRGWFNQNNAFEDGFRLGLKIRFRPGFYYKGSRKEFLVSNNWRVRTEAGLRTRLSYEAYRRAGVPVIRNCYVWLTQNGEPVGLMTHNESPDNEFLKRWGRDGNGSFHKARWYLHNTLDLQNEGFERGNESIMPNPKDYSHCYPKRNRRDSNHSDLIDMIESLNELNLVGRVFDMGTNGSDIEDQKSFFEEHIDRSNILCKYGVDYVLANLDRGNQNHFLYQDVSRDGRWETYPWDLDFTWELNIRDLWNGLALNGGVPPFDRDPAFDTDWKTYFYFGEPFFTRLMAVPEYRTAYVLGVRDHLRETLSERQLFEILDRYGDEGRFAFREDIALWNLPVEGSEAFEYCRGMGQSTDEPMDCIVVWFKDHVKKLRQAAFWGARNEDLDNLTIPPVLSDGRTDPLVPNSDNPIEFCVNAISVGTHERNEGVDTVTLNYRLDAGAIQTDVMEKRTEVSHDGDYFLQIAAQPDGTSIEYWFEMVDDAGLTDRLPETGSLYTEVVDDPTSAESLVTINEIMYHSDLHGE